MADGSRTGSKSKTKTASKTATKSKTKAKPKPPPVDDLSDDSSPSMPSYGGQMPTMPIVSQATRSQSMRDSIFLLRGELLDANVDAIVVPVNNDLALDNKLGSRILHKGGAELEEDVHKAGKVNLGDAVVVRGGRLKAKKVILAACFEYANSIVEDQLVLATRAALLRAREHNLATVAFIPFDVTGEHFPIKRCAEQMISEILRSTEKDTTLESVYFYLGDDIVMRVFQECLKQI